MKLRWIVSAGLVLAIGAWGCSKPQESPETASPSTVENAQGKLRIAVIPKGATHEFWKSVHQGADEAGKELGVEIIWKGPMKEDDRDSQISVVQDFITSKVDGIVLAPLDDMALRQPVLEAQKNGIPVVIIDSGLNDVDTVSFVATDNKLGGKMAGEEMARMMNGKGRVMMLRYQEGSASTEEREAGFMEAIRAHPGIQVVSENQYAGATVETAQKAAENVLSSLKNPDGSLNVAGIFCPNESSTFGMLRVLQDNKWADKVWFVGFDSSAKLVDGLKADEIDALILQNPKKMGYLGVKTLVNSISKKSVDKRIDTGATLVTKSNMAEPEIAALIEPPK